MDIASSYIVFTNMIVDVTGFTRPMLHLHCGMAIYVAVQLLLRDRRASAIALAIVFGAEFINEIFEYCYYGSWRIADTGADIVTTAFWPTSLYTVGKFRRLRWTSWIERRRKQAQALANYAPAPCAMQKQTRHQLDVLTR